MLKRSRDAQESRLFPTAVNQGVDDDAGRVSRATRGLDSLFRCDTGFPGEGSTGVRKPGHFRVLTRVSRRCH